MYLDPEMPNPFEIIVGTYEQYLLGYKVHSVVNVSKFRYLVYLDSVTRHTVFLIDLQVSDGGIQNTKVEI